MVLSDGTVWAWGGNGTGQLGDGTSTTRLTPVQVTGLTSIKALAAGDSHSLALRTDGTVSAWGRNDSGQLGDGSFTWRFRPNPVSLPGDVTRIAAATDHSLAIRGTEGLVSAWGNNFYGQLGHGLAGYYPTPQRVLLPER
ncbi:MAG TPA: hypothetical protein VEU33_31035 [Archangium sp.]|nr:hypothetical protein [Archangium sp.]